MSEFLPRKRKLTQIQVAVLQGLDAGKTRKQIEIEYGINPATIRSSVKALERYGYYFSNNEREKQLTDLQKQVLEEIKKSKKTRREISEVLGIDYPTITKTVRQLIDKELITRDELTERAGTSQCIKKLTDKQQIVLDAIKAGKTKKKTEEEYAISASTYDTIIKALLKKGKLRKEEAVIANLTEQQAKVLQGVRAGKTRKQMVEEHNICYETVSSAQKALIDKGIIKREQLVLSKDITRITEFQENILRDLQSGKNIREIANYYGVSYQKINNEVSNLVKRELITREEIAKATTTRKKELSSQQRIVLKKLKEGTTITEIAKECNIEYKTAYSISKTLVRRGYISGEEIKHSKKGRKVTEVKLNDFEKNILEGLKSGKTKRELAKQYNIDWHVISNMIRAFTRKGLILKGDIKKEEKVEKNTMKNETDLSQKNDLKELVYKDIKNGLTLPEIAKKYNNNKIGTLVFKLIAEERISGSEVKTEESTKVKEKKESKENETENTKKKKAIMGEAQKKETEKSNLQTGAKTIVSKEKDDESNIKNRKAFSEDIKQLQECLKESQIPSSELLRKLHDEMVKSKGYLDEQVVGLILRGYSARKEPNSALMYINECRKFQRDRGRNNNGIENGFQEIEKVIFTGRKEKQAIKNMRWGASIHDSAKDAGISEKRATELYNKYVKKAKGTNKQEEVPTYEIDF